MIIIIVIQNSNKAKLSMLYLLYMLYKYLQSFNMNALSSQQANSYSAPLSPNQYSVHYKIHHMTTSVNHQKAVVEVIVIQSLMFDTNYAEFALKFKSKIQRFKKKNILAT